MGVSGKQLVRGACPHDCPDGCAFISRVEDGRVIEFGADPDHPITDGWLCAKVRPYLDRVYAPDRLAHPLRRSGPKGSDSWNQISWDEAIQEIAERWKAIIREDGGEAILPYSYSGTLGLVEMSVASSRLWNRLGASGLQRSICDAAGEAAVKATIGGRMAPDPRDVLKSRTILIWGHNPASTNPHFMPILRQAQRSGAHVTVIDPRRTTSARSADVHLQPFPATDGALALGILNVIFSESLHDRNWLEHHSIGWRELRDRAAEYPLDLVAATTGVDQEAIIALARRYATEKPGLLKFSDGVQRHGNGGQTVRALLALPAVTGQYGIEGGGIFSSQSDHIPWDTETVGRVSESPPTIRTINMNRLGAALTGEVSNPPVRSLYVFGANPVASSPRAGLIREGMLREDLFTVVHEQFMTDTARLADIVLPSTTQLEHTDLMKPYGHQHLQYNHAAIAPLGEVKSNWTVMRNLATAMGFTEPWLHQDAETIIAEVLDATRETNPFLEGITFERLKRESTVPYSIADERRIPFSDGKFFTPSGKVELKCDALVADGIDALPEYETPAEFANTTRGDQLVLLSGAAHHFVSSSFANQPGLLSKEGHPPLIICPADAGERGLVDGDLVRIENQRGWCDLHLHISDEVRPGVAVSPKGFWPSNSPGGRNVNWVTSDTLADLGGQATFHSTLISVQRTPEATAPTTR